MRYWNVDKYYHTKTSWVGILSKDRLKHIYYNENLKKSIRVYNLSILTPIYTVKYILQK